MQRDSLNKCSSKSEIEAFPRTLDIERALLTGVAHVTELLLIRHGEPELVGSDEAAIADPPLTELGQEQARHLARRLYQERGIARVYTSPLRRAHQTAAAIGEELDLPVIEIYDLREVELRRKSLTCLAGSDRATVDEIRLRFQRTGCWDAFPNSETSLHLRTRVRLAMETIAGMNPARRVAVVCHGGVINAYLAELLGVERDMFLFPRHTSVNVVRTLGDSWSVDRINDVLHLQSAADEGDPLPLLAARG